MQKKHTLQRFMAGLVARNPGQPEFHQAVEEVAESVLPYILDNRKYADACILERMTEPDKTILFRVCWEDDAGNVRVNRGYRVQFNNAVGPYKGGLRFHPSVNLSILKFLGFEQTFKNSLTTLPIGAGKGGSDFNPKGKSNREVMRFCQSFMTQLYQHIGPDMDIPAGDIGVGSREISYLFGQHKRITHEFLSVLTGKALEFGGSLIRTEATGYGNAFFMEEMLNHAGDSVEGKRCLISGAGNVAFYTAQKLVQLGGKVITLSDTSGTIVDEHGLDQEKLEYIKHLKMYERKPLSEYTAKYSCTFHDKKNPWGEKGELAFPCATQNELEKEDALTLIKNRCIAVSEGANMPCTPEAISAFKSADILFAPGKASNAGGVAVSALEMSQNSMRIAWSEQELESRLKNIMQSIHSQCATYGTTKHKSTKNSNYIDYIKGANLAGFIKVADAMLAYGIV